MRKSGERFGRFTAFPVFSWSILGCAADCLFAGFDGFSELVFYPGDTSGVGCKPFSKIFSRRGGGERGFALVGKVSVRPVGACEVD
jgi:hypothetical protein